MKIVRHFNRSKGTYLGPVLANFHRFTRIRPVSQSVGEIRTDLSGQAVNRIPPKSEIFFDWDKPFKVGRPIEGAFDPYRLVLWGSDVWASSSDPLVG